MQRLCGQKEPQTEKEVQGLRETREVMGQLFIQKTRGKAGASLRTMTLSHLQLKNILIVDKQAERWL